MKTTPRHQKIIQILEEYGLASVSDLAGQLCVSENTIRNDLDALAEQGLLMRTHGGAAPLRVGLPPGLRPQGGLASNRANEIVAYALTWIQDGDSLILDGSLLCVMLAERMTHIKNLRVITPSLSVAYLLAQQPSNRVVVAGGEFRARTLSTSGSMVEAAFQNFHSDKAFLSVSGVSTQNGLTDATSDGAQVKRQIKASADSIFVLVESERVGKTDLFPVGDLGEARRIITDSSLTPAAAQTLAAMGARVAVCHEGGHQTYRQKHLSERRPRLGFANLSHGIWFASMVRQGLEQSARQENVDLLVVDNQTDPEIALKNAQDLLKQEIDLLVEYEGTGRAVRAVRLMMREAEIPIIAVDIPIMGATHVGADHDAAGVTAGRQLGRWVQQHWDGHIDRILWVNSSGGATMNENSEKEEVRIETWRHKHGLVESISPHSRFTSALETLQDCLVNQPEVSEVILPGGWATSEDAVRLHYGQLSEVIQSFSPKERILALCLVCESALGLAQAVRIAGRCDQFIVTAFGDASPAVRAELSNPETCLLGVVDLHPERYGEAILSTALRLLKGEVTPPAVFVEHEFLSCEEVQQREKVNAL